MIFKETVEIFNGLLEVATLVECLFGDFDERALFVGYNSCTSGNVIDEGNLTEGTTRIVVDIFLFSSVLLILSFHAVDPFQHDVVVLSSIALFEDDLIRVVMLYLQVHGHLLKGRQLCVERLFDKDDFLDRNEHTFRMLMSSYRS